MSNTEVYFFYLSLNIMYGERQFVNYGTLFKVLVNIVT